MRIETDRARAHLVAVLDSLETAGPDRRSCWCSRPRRRRPRRPSPSPTSAMRTCGGAAFGGALGLERMFRDARGADRHGADDRPAYDFIGRALCGMELFCMSAPLARRRGDVRPEGVGDLGDHPRLLRGAGCPIDVVFYTNYELQVDALLTADIDIAWNSPLAWLDAQRRSGGRLPRHRDARHRSRSPISTLSRRSRRSGSRSWPTCAAARLRSARSTRRRRRSSRWSCCASTGSIPERDAGLSGASTCWSASTATTSAASSRRSDALDRGEAAACAMLDLNWDGWTRDGTIDPGTVRGHGLDGTASTTASSRCVPISTPTRNGTGSTRCSR